MWHMEDVLAVYERPYDPLRPQLCFDERPCQLLGDIVVPMPMKPGNPKREDSEYKRQGTCCVFLAFERQTGFRYVQVRDHRTNRDYAVFMKDLVERYYAHVEQIVLVQDNLNTHSGGSFYDTFEPAEAYELAQKFDYHPTPVKGSWLNMAESELSAFARQCLDRRIGETETLRKEATVWTSKRNKAHKTVNWKFKRKNAREKLEKKYPLYKN